MDDWWYVSKGERQGPVNSDDLRRLLRDGTLTSESLVWKRGMKDWQPAAHVEQLDTFLQSLPPEIPRVENKSKQSSGKDINLALRLSESARALMESSSEQFGFLPSWWQQTRGHLGSTLAFVFRVFRFTKRVDSKRRYDPWRVGLLVSQKAQTW